MADEARREQLDVEEAKASADKAAVVSGAEAQITVKARDLEVARAADRLRRVRKTGSRNETDRASERRLTTALARSPWLAPQPHGTRLARPSRRVPCDVERGAR